MPFLLQHFAVLQGGRSPMMLCLLGARPGYRASFDFDVIALACWCSALLSRRAAGENSMHRIFFGGRSFQRGLTSLIIPGPRPGILGPHPRQNSMHGTCRWLHCRATWWLRSTSVDVVSFSAQKQMFLACRGLASVYRITQAAVVAVAGAFRHRDIWQVYCSFCSAH